MSQGTFSSQPTPPPSGSNGLGIAGLVTSIIGLLTCGALSPISLLISLFGLTKKPKGMAIAGTIISVVGLVVLGTVGYGIIAGLLFLKENAGPSAITQISALQANLKIEMHKDANHALPDDAEGNALLKDIKDGWERPFQYKRIDDTHFEIRSAGLDGQFNTADDIKNEATSVPKAEDDTEDHAMPKDDVEAVDEAADDEGK